MKRIGVNLKHLSQKKVLLKQNILAQAEFNAKKIEYEQILRNMTSEFNEFKQQVIEEQRQKIEEFGKVINELQGNKTELHTALQHITSKIDDAKEMLSVMYVQNNDIDNAIEKSKTLKPDTIISVVNRVLTNSPNKIIPLVDFTASIKESDTRSEAYKRMYAVAENLPQLGEIHVKLASHIRIFEQTLTDDSTISDDQKEHIQNILPWIEGKAQAVIASWVSNSRDYVAPFKAALDEMSDQLMKRVGQSLQLPENFRTVDQMIEFLAATDNKWKIWAYQRAVDRKMLPYKSSVSSYVKDRNEIGNLEPKETQILLDISNKLNSL
ncbi:uncharacterized protein LOC129753718 [Uranotaenia lowii]|uniref:uncharacterized protein LOC129753718 n=1 Tax=Uranotaenia lowii TaxID=190385 RepID=UPI002479D372|nr:uncharacterized protein LOC129753718 [Uranotaenia lowii]